MSFAKSVWENLMSFRINPLPFLPVSFCQCLLWVICWCLSGLNSRVFLPVSFSEFNRCLSEVFPNVFCQVCLKGSLDVFPDQPNIFLASICLMGLISVCLSWFSPVSFCQCLYRRNLLMSARTELACLLASIFLVSSIGVCLKCFPLLVCQCLSSGVTWISIWILSERAQRVSF